MMREFSTRTIAGLRHHKTFKLILPAFSSFLEVNVNKEIEKDKRIILQAAELKSRGIVPATEHIDALLRTSREIDTNFLRDISSLAASIDIRYDEIEQFRRSRVEKLLDAVYGILIEWDSVRSIRSAIKSRYEHESLKLFLNGIFSLYIHETRTLSASVKIPRRLIFAREALIGKVGTIMEQVAGQLAVELAGVVFRVKPP